MPSAKTWLATTDPARRATPVTRAQTRAATGGWAKVSAPQQATTRQLWWVGAGGSKMSTRLGRRVTRRPVRRARRVTHVTI